MQWQMLEKVEQLPSILAASQEKTQVLFKHSTRCSISTTAKRRLDAWEPDQKADFWYVDLLQFRSLSTAIAQDLGVHHESPQVIVLKSGKVIFHESHLGIDPKEIADYL